MVESKANLYFYEDGNLNRFFYINESAIEQLEYKLYKTSKGNISKNLNYLIQLKEYFSCKGLSAKNVKYQKKSLIDFFIAYNNCEGNKIKVYSKNNLQAPLHISVKFGTGIANLKTRQTTPFTTIYEKFDSQTYFRGSVEIEYVFPFNKNKWSVFLEPSYTNYSSSKVITVDFLSEPKQNVDVKFSTIEVPIGIRYRMFLNDHSLFLHSAYVINITTLNSQFDFQDRVDLKIDRSPSSFYLGLGYSFKNRISIEGRYNFGKEILADYAFWGSNLTYLSVILGYKIF